ncbi:unnamed protein product [Adineta ricciae]|uniref:G-protein coupled receptors family 1 profile domain-containing protein n=1 Tax=Adineta ricciae TaxID=249248 RepID=A0A815RCK8_ADIRI|nr:unnamed protein product [Adineta ricciae]CAF1473391.1 unnamed protein product [Adineta ricciae]
MSASDSSVAEAAAITFSKVVFARVWTFSMIGLGVIGHILNVYVFTRRSLWSNACTRYFFAATISGILVVIANAPLRLLQIGFSIDPFGYSIVTCKFLSYLLLGVRPLSSWFIAFASIDRFLCSSRSATLRSWSSVRVATRTIILITITILLIFLYIPITYEILPGRSRCPASQSRTAGFNGIWTLIVFSLCPPIVMLCFGSLTIRHIRQQLKRVQITNNENIAQTQLSKTRRQKRTDRQLIQMMLVQCLYFSVTSLLVSINWFYVTVRPPIVIDVVQGAKDDAFSQISGLISLVGPCTSFYLFTLSSQVFRDELKHLFKCQWRVSDGTTNTGMQSLRILHH